MRSGWSSGYVGEIDTRHCVHYFSTETNSGRHTTGILLLTTKRACCECILRLAGVAVCSFENTTPRFSVLRLRIWEMRRKLIRDPRKSVTCSLSRYFSHSSRHLPANQKSLQKSAAHSTHRCCQNSCGGGWEPSKTSMTATNNDVKTKSSVARKVDSVQKIS